MWEPRRLTTLWASTACYMDSFTFTSMDHNGAQLNLKDTSLYLANEIP
jgi:hypothetical protein